MRIRLCKARLALGLTQSEVARRAGLTRASYTNIERGHKNPSVVTALHIAQVLNRSVEELFADKPPPARLQKVGERRGYSS
ncbi:MAG: hypothetical protein PWR31_444 [Bacillota bacterium]|nr:hypothetical protein [Bacillota bacterium]